MINLDRHLYTERHPLANRINPCFKQSKNVMEMYSYWSKFTHLQKLRYILLLSILSTTRIENVYVVHVKQNDQKING